jgi:pimeloyl-ACP methyl ester carboxylesterase
MLKTTINGISYAYDRRGEGKPVVLIHGFPLDHTIWDLLTPLLARRADVIAPDLRGFGETATSPGKYGLNDLAGDIATLLDKLKLEPAVVVGHSMGGYVALALAHAFPQRVAGLALVASQARADTPERKIGRYNEADDLESHGTSQLAADMSAKLTADPGLQAKLKQLILRQSPAGLAEALRAMAERPDSTPYLESFEFPVAIVHGKDDKLIPLERAREVKEKVKQGTLLELEGAGHMPMMEAPQATAGELIKLLV